LEAQSELPLFLGRYLLVLLFKFALDFLFSEHLVGVDDGVFGFGVEVAVAVEVDIELGLCLQVELPKLCTSYIIWLVYAYTYKMGGQVIYWQKLSSIYR